MKGYRSVRVAGAVFRLILTLGILAVVGIVVWRVFFSTKIPDEVRDLQKNDALTAAWETYGDNLTFRRQEQATITREEQSYGYFSVVDYVIIPEASEVQIIFRYNNSTVKSVAEDLGLSQVPSLDHDVFDVTLVKTTDLTPDDQSDNIAPDALHKTRYFPTAVVSGRTQLYNYRRIVFSGVDIEDLDIGLFVDIYYIGGINYDGTPLGTLCLYDYQMERIDYKFSGSDLKSVKK